VSSLQPSDAIIVKVTLAVTDAENDSCIQADWRKLLEDWAKTNGCTITRIEWQRLRSRFVANPDKDHDDLYWDKIEEKR
jgi:hypothetical protein